MAKRYEELTFSDDFMYEKVTRDLSLTKKLMEMATEEKIENLQFAENQKTLMATMEGKDVRLDSYILDEKGNVYDAEMQNRSPEDKRDDPQLPKRSRYYQGMIDTNILFGGCRYKDLKKSYIVFFCTFDPFGKNLKRYTFENQCLELPGLKLNDESIKIFFNSKGKDNGSPITKEQDDFLRYLDTGEITDDFTRQLDEAVEEVRENKKWRAEYMHTLVHEQDIRDEGIAIGIERGIERGIEQGIEQGMEQGRNDERITIVINAINSGMTESEIVSKLCIPQETIDAAKTEMDSNK